jgi:hypothetical protein
MGAARCLVPDRIIFEGEGIVAARVRRWAVVEDWRVVGRGAAPPAADQPGGESVCRWNPVGRIRDRIAGEPSMLDLDAGPESQHILNKPASSKKTTVKHPSWRLYRALVVTRVTQDEGARRDQVRPGLSGDFVRLARVRWVESDDTRLADAVREPEVFVPSGCPWQRFAGLLEDERGIMAGGEFTVSRQLHC